VTAQYEKQFDQVETKLRKQVRGLEADRKQLSTARNEELFTTGEAALSLLRGRTTYTLSRVSRARRYKGYIEEGVNEAEAMISELELQLDELQSRMEQDLAALNARWGERASAIEEYRITPFKKDIYLGVFGIGWKPHWLVMVNGQPQMIAAWEGVG
jgi:hypothetical protein